MRGERVQGKSAKRLCNFGIRSGSERLGDTRLRGSGRELGWFAVRASAHPPPAGGAHHLTELLLARRIRLYN